MELKDWLNSINLNKKNLIDEDSSIEKDYSPYIINRCLSGHFDVILLVNEMNLYSALPKKMQYDFYINSVRKRKRFSPWMRKDEIDNINVIKKYYECSNERAKEIIKILNKEQVNFIKSKFEIGGKK